MSKGETPGRFSLKPPRQGISVLIVTSYWDPPEAGMHFQCRTLASELASKNSVSIFFIKWKAKKMLRRQNGNIVIYTRRLYEPFNLRHPLKNLLGWLLDLPAALYCINKVCKEQKIDIIHFEGLWPLRSIFSLYRFFGGPPYIVSLHGGDTTGFLKQHRFNRWLQVYALKRASAVVPVSQDLFGLAREIFYNLPNLKVIHNGIGLNDYSELAEEGEKWVDKLSLPQNFFLTIGDLSKVKGQDIAIRAFGQLSSELPDINLVIAGEGDCRKEYEDLIRLHKCEKAIFLIGQVPHYAIPSLLKRSLALIQPSRHEGLGIAILEAGAMKLPVIASAVGGIPEILTHGISGLLVPSDDLAALAKAILRLASDELLRKNLGLALYEKVKRDFSSRAMAEEYVNVYRSVIKKRGQPILQKLTRKERRCPECYICGSGRVKKFGDYEDFHFEKERPILHLQRCLDCKTIFLHPRPPDFYGRNHFTLAYSGGIDNRYYNDDYKKSVAKIRLNYLRNDLKFNSILDIGCGKGFFLKEASNIGIRVCGVEISGPAFEFACSLIGKDAMRKRIEEVTDKYDLIVLWDVIEHQDNPAVLLKELRERLNTRGHLVLTTGNIDNFELILKPKNHWILFADHKFYFCPASITYCLDKAGYRVNRILDLQYLEKHLLKPDSAKVLEKANLCMGDIILKIAHHPKKIFKIPIVLFKIIERKYLELLLGPNARITIMTVISQLE